MDNLNDAIGTQQQADISTVCHHPSRTMNLNNLSCAQLKRFERTESMDDLNLAITTYKQAVTVTLSDHPDQALYFNNLGIALQRRFERTGSMDEPHEAIITNEESVAICMVQPSIRIKAEDSASRLLLRGDWDPAKGERAKAVLRIAVEL